jgi:Eukaryotic DNA topoisomerase I, DNA binding fragment
MCTVCSHALTLLQLGDPETAKVFSANFFKDWQDALATGHPLKKGSLAKCDFTKIREHLKEQRVIKKAAKDEEKAIAKAEKVSNLNDQMLWHSVWHSVQIIVSVLYALCTIAVEVCCSSCCTCDSISCTSLKRVAALVLNTVVWSLHSGAQADS